MSAVPNDIIQFPASPEFKRLIEAEAARLNLTIGAYVQYLVTRLQRDVGADRFDRMVDEVFGRYGQTMRNLAK